MRTESADEQQLVTADRQVAVALDEKRLPQLTPREARPWP